MEEKTLRVAHPAMTASPIRLLIVLLLCLFVVGIPVLLLWWLRSRATTLTVTNLRSILRRGLLAKHETEVWHAHVRNVQVSQSFLQRLIGVGYIGISSAGQSGVEIAIAGVRDPSGIQALINKHRTSSPPTR